MDEAGGAPFGGSVAQPVQDEFSDIKELLDLLGSRVEPSKVADFANQLSLDLLDEHAKRGEDP